MNFEKIITLKRLNFRKYGGVGSYFDKSFPPPSCCWFWSTILYMAKYLLWFASFLILGSPITLIWYAPKPIIQIISTIPSTIAISISIPNIADSLIGKGALEGWNEGRNDGQDDGADEGENDISSFSSPAERILSGIWSQYKSEKDAQPFVKKI